MSLADNILNKCCEKENGMHKLFAIGIAVYLAGDPDLSLLASISDSKVLMVASALALVTVPWVISQIDN
jgi:hypothetical protein